uniref:Uncharacterized protein n=1 Tax=Candidatus Kentrum eta TaxID=2126337 RepID=A0A450V439_9GAMM|nr:MAG: hypothetical protein BECKH772A_GA0070896_100347 [Candidatus Kentron sp. H]VFJ92942.1 MAG: hypothetical protein BECKH772B_GA0070898_100367 [Candidatus Kentron sp. H]VFJ99557.1 MAG: hypothetical protein BECKH772C_GA0070978_100337 [Candidatus Kentron sp. H]
MAFSYRQTRAPGESGQTGGSRRGALDPSHPADEGIHGNRLIADC